MAEVTKDLDLLAQVANVLLTLAMLHDEFHCRDLASILSPTLVYLSKREFTVRKSQGSLKCRAYP